MFKILTEKFGDFTKVKILNCKSGEYVSIIPEFGANINELILKKNKLFSIIDGAKNFSELINNKWFKSAKLIPFPNRINKGIYSYNNAEFKLPINFPTQNHAIHGLIYNKTFKVRNKKTSKTSARIVLEYFGNKISGYPFNFSVMIEYTLSSKGFKCKTIITNQDKVQIPVGDGWHPYFKLGRKVDNLFLKIPSTEKVLVNKLMIPTGKTITMKRFYSLTKINRQEFDTGFVIKSKNKVATTEIKNKELDVTIRVWQETGKNKYNYLHVFIPPSRKSIAIEPMTCNTNAFNNKQGIIILKPNGKFCATYGVNLA